MVQYLEEFELIAPKALESAVLQVLELDALLLRRL